MGRLTIVGLTIAAAIAIPTPTQADHNFPCPRFDELDLDQDGGINFVEWWNYFHQSGIDFEEADINSDGKVDASEYLDLLAGLEFECPIPPDSAPEAAADWVFDFNL